MELFKKKIRQRILLLTSMIITILALGIRSFSVINDSIAINNHHEFVSGFQFGLIWGLEIIALFQIVRLRTIIKDEQKLKILYNKENDERLKVIRSKSGMPMILFTTLLIIVAAIIAGYYNFLVFITLVIVAASQLLLSTLVKLYYMKTM